MRLGAVLLTLAMLLTGCSNKSKFELLALAVAEAADNLVEQNDEASDALTEAEEARLTAMVKGELSYNSDEVTELVEKWDQAESEVAALRKKFNTAIREADFFFAYAESRRDLIADTDLGQRVAGMIQQKKNSFAAIAHQTNAKVKSLEALVQQGNDVFVALEIVGVMNAMDRRIVSLGEITGEAIDLSKEIRQLHREASEALEIEMEFTS